MRPQVVVINGLERRKLNLRRGKCTTRNAAQSTQSSPHLKQLAQSATHLNQPPMDQPAKDPSNKQSAPGTARQNMLKHQGGHKKSKDRVKESDAQQKRRN